MLRSLWTAASGMNAQQTNVDTIANNLANINTTGYKAESAEFKSLLYQNLQSKTTSANGTNKPVSAQVGLGVRTSSVSSDFTQGSFLQSDNNFSFAINGKGFFAVSGVDGQIAYTRNGNFNISQGTDGLTLCTSEGYPVLDSTGPPIVFDAKMKSSNITVNSEGAFCYPDASNNPAPIGISLGVYQFANPTGLDKTAASLFTETDASRAAINEADDTGVSKSTIKQSFLEGSNVQVATEMVNLITAQRAYELNSKAINASDEMLQQANNLKR